MGIEKEPWYLNVIEQIEAFNQRLDDKIDKQQQQDKACKKKTELEIKLVQEIKLNNELTERMTELSRRGSELDRVCAMLESHLTIADSDQQRLDNARETYQLAKEMTGVRFDYSAPPGRAKGYIKSESRKLLQPFDLEATDCEGLWTLINGTAAPGWPNINKENKAPN